MNKVKAAQRPKAGKGKGQAPIKTLVVRERDAAKVKGGAKPAPSGPTPIPYPNEGTTS